nr:AAA family ATPase [Roseibium hamelinense]
MRWLSELACDNKSGNPTERIDTHANTIILNGDFAFKIKRPVKFPFLDYSSLSLRENACKHEIEYNAPHAPQVYREAVPITRQTGGQLVLNGDGIPIEWVVVMNRFDHRLELDELAEKGPFDKQLGQQLADMMADAHAKAPVRTGAGFLDGLNAYIDQNDAAFKARPDLFDTNAVDRLTSNAQEAFENIRPLLRQRAETGSIRLCHGDAHLRNIVLIDGTPVLFDAVEFSDEIATCDVLYDLAFLLMDLWERKQRACANFVFNRYLDKTHRPDELDGLAALPFFLMMRASIRAKIAASASENQDTDQARAEQEIQARRYFDFAQDFLEAAEPVMIGIGGLSGSGKTTLAYALAPSLGRAPGARVLRTDVERKARLGISETEKAPEEAYTQQASSAVYEALAVQCKTVLEAGHSVIFDGVFAKEEERAECEVIAGLAAAGFCGLWLSAPKESLVARVDRRGGDASDATGDIVERQLTYDIGQNSWTKLESNRTKEDTKNAASLVLSCCGILQNE